MVPVHPDAVRVADCPTQIVGVNVLINGAEGAPGSARFVATGVDEHPFSVTLIAV
jgi:hypothetical protein